MKNNHVTRREVLARLSENGIPFSVLDIGAGRSLVISQHGGRAFGPFAGEGESLNWICEAFKDARAYEALYKQNAWNQGGERFWFNPELKFFCDEPRLFDETYRVQAGMDPGRYALRDLGGRALLTQQAEFEVLGDGTKKACGVSRLYAPAGNPLRYLKSFQEGGPAYYGYTQTVRVEDLTPERDVPLEPWLLIQVNPGGRVVVPLIGEADFVDYYTPVGALQTLRPGYAELSFTGEDKYKVAYRSASTIGRMGYLRRAGDIWSLMIRNYYNDPSAPYCSEPWGNLGDKGCSAYFYNDDLSNGGFGEFENGLPPIGREAGATAAESTTAVWFFEGGAPEIKRAMRALLGVDYPVETVK